MAVSHRYRQPTTSTHPQSDFGSLFRLLDDWESHRSALGGISAAGTAFSPRFDVRETKDAYLLDGELPGINQKDINIEFSDPHTLVINGRAERSYTLGTPPGKRIEGGFMQPSVSEMEEEGELSRAASGGMKQGKGGGQPQQQQQQGQQGQHMHMKGAGTMEGEGGGGGAGGGHRYWVSERSVGEFQRTFNFPTRVDQEGVSALLREGILSVKVPKAGAQAAKKIPIEHECTY